MSELLHSLLISSSRCGLPMARYSCVKKTSLNCTTCGCNNLPANHIYVKYLLLQAQQCKTLSELTVVEQFPLDIFVDAAFAAGYEFDSNLSGAQGQRYE